MSLTDLQAAHLSLQQARLNNFASERQVYRVQCAVSIQGVIDPMVLQQVLQQVVNQHEILRTTFSKLPGMDVPLQIIHAQTQHQFSCPIVHIEQSDEMEQAQIIEHCIQQLVDEPFLRETGPLIRALLLSMPDTRHVLLLSIDAFCADGSTLKHLIREVSNRYQMEVGGKPDDTEEEQLHYVDVSSWQDELRASEEGQTQLPFWANIDLSSISTVQLPLTYNENNFIDGLMQFVPQQSRTLTIDQSEMARIQDIVKLHNASTEAFFLACWQLLLFRLTNHYSGIIGVTCHGRMYEELTAAIGPYTRILPLHTTFSDDMSFKQLLTQVNHTHKEICTNQLSFNWKESSEQPTKSIPYFPISYEFEDWADRQNTETVHFSIFHYKSIIEPFALKLSVLEESKQTHLELDYNSYHYTSTQIDALAECFHVLLQGIIATPQACIETFPLLTEDKQQEIIHFATGKRHPLPIQTLSQQFEQQAQLCPHSIAIRCGNITRTYAELNAEANQVARILHKMGIGPNICVGIYMERSVEALIGLLGVLKAGGVYVPLDIEHPTGRIMYQIQQTKAKIVLTQQHLVPHLTAIEYDILCLDSDPRIGQEETENLNLTYTVEDLASIIYTSGSTGYPKGVMIRHRGISNYTHAMSEIIASEAGLHFATVSTLAADLGNTAIFCSLASGGCLHVLPYETITSAKAFARYTTRYPIDVLKIVPTHLSALISSPEIDTYCLPRRHLVLGGEVLPQSLLQHLDELGYTGTIINHYGPTEATVGSIINILYERAKNLNADMRKGSVPIGSPLANTEAYILNTALQLQPKGAIGELYLGGEGLAAGYLHQPEQTTNCFLAHPFKQAGNAQIYKTGDLARYTDNGFIEYIGRMDSQIKIRGFRVEIGEIESVLHRHENVRECVVIWQKEKRKEPELIAYITTHTGSLFKLEEMHHFLAQYLPAHMLPTTFVILRFLPLTTNGKVDRQFLSHASNEELHQRAIIVQQSQEQASQIHVQARDETELQLWQIWEDLLGRPLLSVFDNFFDLGGHSIIAVQLMSRIYKQFGRELALTVLFQHPTLADLAVILRQETNAYAQRPILVPLHKLGTRPPFFCIHPAGGNVLCYQDLAQQLGEDQPFYALQAPFFEELDIYNNLPALATRYIAAIQEVQQHGPYYLGGWSLGGVIAFEMAYQLQKKGEEIALLTLIDSMVPDTLLQPEKALEKPDISDAGLLKEILQTQTILTKEALEKLASLTPEEQLLFVCEQLKKLNLIPADVSLPLYRKFAVINLLLKYAASSYRPTPISQKIILFRAADDFTKLIAYEKLTHEQKIQGWQKLAKEGVTVHILPGTHMDLVYKPGVQQLGSILRASIDMLQI